MELKDMHGNRFCYEGEGQGSEKEIKRLQEEKKELEKQSYSMEKYPNVNFKFQPVFSMIDGKTKNTITGNKSAQSCSDCMATPTDIRLDKIEKFEVKNPEYLMYGAISLHFGPRAFGWLFHMAAHQPFKKYYCPANKKKERE